MADRQGNWRRQNLCYASELPKCVLILDSIPSSIQQDLIMRNEVLYGFVVIIIGSGGGGGGGDGRRRRLDWYVGDSNL